MPTTEELNSTVGIVVIGRNEGARLKKCLESVESSFPHVVYVDSGSTDGSSGLARTFGATVVELDLSIPFCAARARNEGYKRLLEISPSIEFIQFIDADCELTPNWIEFAVKTFKGQPGVAIIAGWLSERYPEASIYNRLGDLEWNFSGTGEVDSVGGIFLIRRMAFDSIGGFDITIAAGEEPELCKRLIQRSWRIQKIRENMATHDLAMTHFGQWWRRSMRSGYGSLDVDRRFGIKKFRRNNRRVFAWTMLFFTFITVGVFALLLSSNSLAALAILLFALLPIQVLRIARRTRKLGYDYKTSAAYGFFMAISFLPQILGQVRYFLDGLRNQPIRLLEYKHAPKKQ